MSFDPSQHPRGKGGKFVRKADVADELERRLPSLSAGDRAKAEEMIGRLRAARPARPKSGRGPGPDASGKLRDSAGRFATREAVAAELESRLPGLSGKEAGKVSGMIARLRGGEQGGSQPVALEDGRHVSVGRDAGFVPARLRPAAGEERFTRKHLEDFLGDHYEKVSGGTGGQSAAEAAEWENAGTGYGQTTFHKALPQEVRRYLEGNPNARRLFRVTDDPRAAGGEDAMRDLGEDRYFAHVDAASGNKMSAAVEAARASHDPEVQFLAHVHDNLPASAPALKAQATKLRRKIAGAKTPKEAAALKARADDLDEQAAAAAGGLENIRAGGLVVGDKFTINGEAFRVAEDADGLRVLEGKDFGEPVPVDALTEIPIDKGSFRASDSAGKPARRRGKTASRRRTVPHDDGIPF